VIQEACQSENPGGRTVKAGTGARKCSQKKGLDTGILVYYYIGIRRPSAGKGELRTMDSNRSRASRNVVDAYLTGEEWERLEMMRAHLGKSRTALVQESLHLLWEVRREEVLRSLRRAEARVRRERTVAPAAAKGKMEHSGTEGGAR